MICHMESGALCDWLYLDGDPDIDAKGIAANKHKIQEWWKANRRLIENNIDFE